ncbi:unnamed protein product [Clonostachys rhizophaga]|uniref:Nephrocystin 3-like N-terminal domain-containing protein n=1 Tax=Clonostachys rhizophaga TaxID=160324 RepID=A0A9N9VHR2_9HYPO|nr:unnamed protein product [Clonostachys rhizophaga]
MSPANGQTQGEPGAKIISSDHEDAVIIGRDDVSDFNEENILPQPAHVQEAIRSWLKPTSYDAENGEYKKHLASYLPGTGEWLLESPTFREWHQSQNQGMLWIKGIPGSGKSVIASSLVNHLSKEGAPVLYFFFRQIIDANHKPDALLRDWLAQLLSYSPPLQARLKESVDKRQSLSGVSMATMWQDIKSAVAYIPKVYCVVDALDEMDSNQDAFLQALAELGRWRPSRLKIIITSRPVPKVERPLRQEPILHIRLDEKHVDEDIANYVAHHLDKTSKLLTPEQKQIIKRAVPGRANGLFLYAKLAMDAFLEENADVEEVLKTLPLDLNVMYTDLLREHARRSGVPHDLQLLILSFVTHASRPLRLLEIAEMIRVTEEAQAKAIGSLEALKDLVRAACGPLLEILPDETVCVIHHSFTEFLNGSTRTAESSGDAYPILEMNSTHNRLSLCCLSYLLSGCLQKVKLPDDDDYESDSEWGDHYYVMPTVNKELRLNYPFLAYSMHNWHVHGRKSNDSGPFSDELYDATYTILSEENYTPLSVLVDNGGSKREHLHTAALLGLSQYLTKFVQENSIDVNSLDKGGEAAIFYAANAGHASVAKVLLGFGANPDEPSNYDGKRPLHKAAERDHGEVVTLLLEAGVDPLTKKTKCDPGLMCGDPYRYIGHTPLMYAMCAGNTSAARAFLPFLNTAEMASRALGWAVGSRNEHSRGCPGILDELLQHPLVDVNRLVRGETPLYIASRTPNTKLVITLLKAGADPSILSSSQGEEFCRESNRRRMAEKRKNKNQTALHGICGAARRYIMSSQDKDEEPELLQECVSLMLKAGVDINAKDRKGCTALHYAVRWWPTLVRALVNAGADSNIMSDDGSSPLHACQSIESFRILVEDGKADINHQRESDGKTPIMMMTDMYNKPKGFYSDLIRLHVDLGADLTITAHDGHGVLHDWISRSPDLSVEHEVETLDMLLSSGIQLNNTDKQGKTVMHSLRGLGSGLDLTLKLVAAGADLNIRDKLGRIPLYYFVQDAQRNLNKEKFVAALEKLISIGAELDAVDYQGRNLLFAFMNVGQFGRDTMTVIQELVDRGLDPKAIDYQGNTLFHEIVGQTTRDFDSRYLETPLTLGVDPDQPNFTGQSALHFMVAPRNQDSAKGLHHFKHFDIQDMNGIRPLHVAIQSSEVLVHALLSNGASPTEPTEEGVTPLHVAARFRKPDIVGLLLEAIEAKLGKQGLVDHLNTFHSQRTPTALHLACRSGVPETVSLLLAAEADPNAKTSHVGTPLEWCIQYEAEKALWKSDEDNYSSPNGSSPDRTGFGPPRGISIDDDTRNKLEKDDQCSTQLEKILSLLLAHGADMTSQTDKGLTELDQAIIKCESSHDYTIDCLVRLRQSIAHGNTDDILATATKQDIKTYVHSLIDNPQGFSLDVVNKIVTSISRRLAAHEAFLQVAPWRKFQTSELDVRAFVAFLRDLMEQHDWDSVKHVLRQEPRILDTESGGDILSKLVKFGMESIVGAAVTREEILQLQNDRDEGIRQSKQKGKKLLARRLTSFYPLCSACESPAGNMPMVRYLVEELGVDINDGFYSWPSYRQNVVEYEKVNDAVNKCCSGDHWWQVAEALPYLLKHGPNLEARDVCGRTTLLWALGCSSNYKLRIIKTLIEAGADVNAVDSSGRNCLSTAGNDIDLTLLLLKHGAAGSTEALTSSIQNCNIPVLQALLDAGANPNQFQAPPEGLPSIGAGWISATQSQLPPVFLAAMHRKIVGYGSTKSNSAPESMVKVLLDHGANPFTTFVKRSEPQDDDYMTEVTVLHQLLREGGASRLFLDMPDLDLEYQNQEGMTLLLAACSSRADPDVPIEDVYGDSRRNITEVVANDEPEAGGPTIIEKLLERGAAITAQDNRQRNALHLILSVPSFTGYKSLRLILSKAPELLHQTDIDGLSPFHYALRRTPPAQLFGQFGVDTKAIEILLEAGADPKVPDPNRNSALHHVGKFLACDGRIEGQIDKPRQLFKHLVSLGVPINCRNNKGETPAFSVLIFPPDNRLQGVSVPEGELKAQETLIETKADLRAVNNAGETLLHVVARTDPQTKRNQNMVTPVIESRFRWLLDQGLDPMAEDEKSRTCLDVAAAKENTKILAMFKRPGE